MLHGYVFISNSTRPSKEEESSRMPIHLENVNRPCLQTALKMGYTVFFGVNRVNPDELVCELPVFLFDAHTYRSLFDLKSNIIAFRNLSKIIRAHDIEVIHCNTPVGGMIGRLCGRWHGVKKVIYTVHGFHFYKGAPLINRTILRWAEQIMARWTDAIITMNKEDFESAKQFTLRSGGKVYSMPGVGIDVSQYRNTVAPRQEIREGLGIHEDDILLISMGDLIPRKDYQTAIRAIAKAQDKRLQYCICGTGSEFKALQSLSRTLNIAEQIHFLGHRSDIKELLKASDLFLLTTSQEGLPRSLMEAMASGLPCIASKVRGNVDLLDDGINGSLCDPQDVDAFADAICSLADDPGACKRYVQNSWLVIERYDISRVQVVVERIYQDVIGHETGSASHAEKTRVE